MSSAKKMQSDRPQPVTRGGTCSSENTDPSRDSGPAVLFVPKHSTWKESKLWACHAHNFFFWWRTRPWWHGGACMTCLAAMEYTRGPGQEFAATEPAIRGAAAVCEASTSNGAAFGVSCQQVVQDESRCRAGQIGGRAYWSGSASATVCWGGGDGRDRRSNAPVIPSIAHCAPAASIWFLAGLPSCDRR